MKPASHPFRLGQSGWPVLEWALVFTLAGLLAWTFWLRVGAMMEGVERRSFEQQLQNLRDGLRIETIRRVAQAPEKLPRLAEDNPVRFLRHPPPHYAGERSADDAEPEPPAWFFDRERRELVYLPRYRDELRADAGRIRLAVRSTGQQNKSAIKTMDAIRLEPVLAFRWQGRDYRPTTPKEHSP